MGYLKTIKCSCYKKEKYITYGFVWCEHDIGEYYINLHFTQNYNFRTVTQNQVSKLIWSIKSTAVGSDVIYINFIIFCCPFILTHIVNFCIINAVFPDSWRLANIPLTKVDSPKDYKNLRPSSILPVLLKIVEKINKITTCWYRKKKYVLPNTQSGFRKVTAGPLLYLMLSMTWCCANIIRLFKSIWCIKIQKHF